MGRPKQFSRDGVLAKAYPVFWRNGFADTSVQQLEQATGVNKSGLYAEFANKEDLFLQSLQYYLDEQEKQGTLTATPLGWRNVERFLKLAPPDADGQKGCYSVSCMRELSILPPKAATLVAHSRANTKRLLARNIEAERPTMDPDVIAELVLTFFTGLSVEHSLKPSWASVARKIDRFMTVIRAL
jgi:TetR/AcrR family transcriptional regulator, copper-responsive repressor